MSASLPPSSPPPVSVAVLAASGQPVPNGPGWELRTVFTPDAVHAAVQEGSADVVLLLAPPAEALARLAGVDAPLVLVSDEAPGPLAGPALHAWLPAAASLAQVDAALRSGARRHREASGLLRQRALLGELLDLAHTLGRLRSPEDVLATATPALAAVLAGEGASAALVARFGLGDELRYFGVGRYHGLDSDLDLPAAVVEAVARAFGRADRAEVVDEGLVLGIAGTGSVQGALLVEGAVLPAHADALGPIAAGLVGQALSNTVLFQRSSLDALTGLYARGFGLHRLGELLALAARHPSPLCVLALDLDDFKGINDRHGHAGGDAVLVAVADLIRATLRTTDLAVRLGGEEFLVILPYTDEAAAAAVAERLRRVVAAWRGQHEGAELSVKLSIGVAEAGPGERDAMRLVGRADDALYAAKRQGRNRVIRAG